MKKCLLLYISLFFCVSPLSWSMDYNQDEDGYGQNDDSMSMQNGMMQNNMMMQQPGMMPQNGMMMNQGMTQMPQQMPMQNGMMQNNMMMQQPGMMPQNGMMMNQMDSLITVSESLAMNVPSIPSARPCLAARLIRRRSTYPLPSFEGVTPSDTRNVDERI